MKIVLVDIKQPAVNDMYIIYCIHKYDNQGEYIKTIYR